MPRKSIFFQITPIFPGIFFDLGGGLSFPSKFAYDIEQYFTFLPDKLVCFYTKNAQKSIFPQIATYIFPQIVPTGHFIDSFGR